MNPSERASMEVEAEEATMTDTSQWPFTLEELEACTKVVKCLLTEKDLLYSAPMRAFRKEFAPLSELFETRKYGGSSRKKYLEDKQRRADQKAKLTKIRAQDKNYINSSALRSQRRQKLESLIQQDPTLPLIADGAAEEPAAALMEDATEKELRLLHNRRSCYTCKTRFSELHEFYDLLCPRCAGLNYEKRFQTADLSGKVALVTGSRVKIGFQTTIKLLLAGARVIATTRFPQDAVERYSKHAKFASFQDRLSIYGIDFRDLVHLEEFLDHIVTKYDRLDIIIHNACQTIRRPPAYYSHLIEKESMALKMIQDDKSKAQSLLLSDQNEFLTQRTTILQDTSARLDQKLAIVPSALKSQIVTIADDEELDPSLFPKGHLDVNQQQIDLRKTNSWLLKLGQVSTPEVAEVFAINTLAPFIMNNRLVTLMDQTPEQDKFIVNVSAMEGKFYRYKTPRHPHTNMAKAALNMMTRTCAEDLSKRRIYMNSVDTGWINDENPLEKASQISAKSGFETPIDEIDAAARILDPVFMGFNETEKQFGLFFKDYHPTEWCLSNTHFNLRRMRSLLFLTLAAAIAVANVIPQGKYVIQYREPGHSNGYYLTYRKNIGLSVIRGAAAGTAITFATVAAMTALFSVPVFFSTFFTVYGALVCSSIFIGSSINQMELSAKEPLVFTVHAIKTDETAFFLTTDIILKDKQVKKMQANGGVMTRSHQVTGGQGQFVAEEAESTKVEKMVYLKFKGLASDRRRLRRNLYLSGGKRQFLGSNRRIAFSSKKTKWHFIPIEDF